MSLYTSDEVILYCVFPTSLKRTTLSWFIRLSPFSIDCFETLVAKFGTQFAMSLFIERFEKVALNIQNLSPEVDLHHMVITLKLGPFADSLYKKPVIDLDELRRRSTKFMQLEKIYEF